MLDGRKIPMSDETAKSLRKEVKENVVTQFPSTNDSEGYIDNKWVISFYSKNADENTSNLYLPNYDGQWYNEKNEKVSGYFYFLPE